MEKTKAIITMHNRRVIRQEAIAVGDKKIIDVGKNNELKRKYRRGYEKIDAKCKVVIPGLINTHQHAAMSLLRGYADDLPLQEWLEKWIWPIEKHMSPHDIYVGASLTAVESIMGGTTAVNTMYHYTRARAPLPTTQRSQPSGLRSKISRCGNSDNKRQNRYGKQKANNLER